jgi:hypothetical protein
MPNDPSADEIYTDREMLNRLGYGIFDVRFGHTGVGFENVKDFSYVVRQHQDPKLYRRKVFDLTGKYYRNDLAKEIWDKFVDHKWVLSEQKGREISLEEAAKDWIENLSHTFLKEWTFKQPQVPFRIRSRREPRKGILGLVTGVVFPNLKELLDAGFTVTDIIWAKVKSLQPIAKPRFSQTSQNKAEPYLVLKRAERGDFDFIKLVASLTGHKIANQEEAQKRWREILEHKWYMSEREGHDVGIKEAALDYYRRLNLLAETERGSE